MINFVELNVQIDKMLEDRSLKEGDLADRIDRAIKEMEDASKEWEGLVRKIEGSKTSWLLPHFLQPISWGYPPPKKSDPVSVVAVDGSQIFPDRHELALCYLVNIGLVAIHYGTKERPVMRSIPTLFWKEEDMFVEWGNRRIRIDGEILGVRRTVMEMEALVKECVSLKEGGKERIVGLVDGSLILWRLEGCPQDFRASVLGAFSLLLERMKEERIPVAGYISSPGSTDIVNSLRVKICPLEYPDCDMCPFRSSADRPDRGIRWPSKGEEDLPCSAFSGFPDRLLWGRLLKVGESTSVFGSSSKVLDEYGDHRIDFFYMRVGEEVARVEVPRWVSVDEDLLELVRYCVWDQVVKGDGYPVVLAEAHEQAVIRGGERDFFFRMLERSLVGKGIRAAISAKAARKRRMMV